MNNLQLWSPGNEILPIGYFTTLGLSQERAESLYAFQLVLSTVILKNEHLLTDMKILSIRKQNVERGEMIDGDYTPLHNNMNEEFKIVIREGLGFVIYHADLLPLWQKLAATFMDLSTFLEDLPTISLSIGNVELHDDVLDVLLPSIKEIPLRQVVLRNNRLGRSINFLKRLLQAGSSIEALVWSIII